MQSEVIHATPFSDLYIDCTLRVKQPPETLRLVPTTFAPGMLGSFQLTVVCDRPFQLEASG